MRVYSFSFHAKRKCPIFFVDVIVLLLGLVLLLMLLLLHYDCAQCIYMASKMPNHLLFALLIDNNQSIYSTIIWHNQYARYRYGIEVAPQHWSSIELMNWCWWQRWRTEVNAQNTDTGEEQEQAYQWKWNWNHPCNSMWTSVSII